MKDWKIVKTLRKQWRTLIETGDAPTAIAGGVALGVFLGFTPLFGLKTLLALGGAWALRWNKTAAVIGVTLHDIATPLSPVVIEMELLLGDRILSRHVSTHATLHEILHHPKQLLEWTTFLTVGQPLLVGSLAMGIPVALIFYFVLNSALKAESRRIAKKVEMEDLSSRD